MRITNQIHWSYQLADEKTIIECEWLETNRALVNPDGQVWPCCFLANQQYKFAQKNEYLPSEDHPALVEYNKLKDELNIHNDTLTNILKHEWFEKTLPESWKDPANAIRQCEKFCSKKAKI